MAVAVTECQGVLRQSGCRVCALAGAGWRLIVFAWAIPWASKRPVPLRRKTKPGAAQFMRRHALSHNVLSHPVRQFKALHFA